VAACSSTRFYEQSRNPDVEFLNEDVAVTFTGSFQKRSVNTRLREVRERFAGTVDVSNPEEMILYNTMTGKDDTYTSFRIYPKERFDYQIRRWIQYIINGEYPDIK